MSILAIKHCLGVILVCYRPLRNDYVIQDVSIVVFITENSWITIFVAKFSFFMNPFEKIIKSIFFELDLSLLRRKAKFEFESCDFSLQPISRQFEKPTVWPDDETHGTNQIFLFLSHTNFKNTKRQKNEIFGHFWPRIAVQRAITDKNQDHHVKAHNLLDNSRGGWFFKKFLFFWKWIWDMPLNLIFMRTNVLSWNF